MVVEVRRKGKLLAKSETPHYGSIGPGGWQSPQTSELADFYIEKTICKALGRPHLSPFDQLVNTLADEMARQKARRRVKGKRILLVKSLRSKRVLLLKAEPASLRAAGLLSQAREHAEARYEPNAPVNDAVLRRVLAAAKRGVLNAADLQAVQDAHRVGLALPGFVLRKLAEVRS
jgi:hypothetical protein